VDRAGIQIAGNPATADWHGQARTRAQLEQGQTDRHFEKNSLVDFLAWLPMEHFRAAANPLTASHGNGRAAGISA
jgi:hypothetical protein